MQSGYGLFPVSGLQADRIQKQQNQSIRINAINTIPIFKSISQLKLKYHEKANFYFRIGNFRYVY